MIKNCKLCISLIHVTLRLTLKFHSIIRYIVNNKNREKESDQNRDHVPLNILLLLKIGVLFCIYRIDILFESMTNIISHKLSTDCTKRAIYFSKYNTEFFSSRSFCTANHFCRTCICKVDAKRSHAPVYQISRSSRAPVTRL